MNFPLTRSTNRARFFGISGPTLALDFVDGGVFDPRITFTRASSATYFDSAGVLQSAAINAPRLDYNPSTLAARGLLIEEQRTNSIRNNTMQGAVAGTPGTLPTNWVGSSPIDGINREIVGTGTTNGITWIDLKFSGTSSTGGAQLLVQFEGAQVAAALQNQTWTPSLWVAVVGGSTANFSTLTIRHRYYNSGGSAITALDTSILSSVSATLTRFAGTAFAATDATTAFTSFLLNADFVNSSAIDITLRIGLPQLELGAFATSVIPTTTTALTRSADVASVNTLSPWYNATEGTLYAEWTAQAFTYRAASFNDTTQNNAIGFVATAAGIGSNVYVSGAFQGTAGVSGTFTTGTTYKQATAYKLNDTQDFANGVAGTTDTTISIPTVTQLLLGAGRAGMASTPGNGWLRRITYYTRRVTQAEGIALTA